MSPFFISRQMEKRQPRSNRRRSPSSLSYSKYLKVLEPYFEKNTPGFNDNRSTMREILQKDNDLAEIVQLVGKSALSEADKVTLEVATMIKVSLGGVEHGRIGC